MAISEETKLALYKKIKTYMEQCTPPMLVKENKELYNYELIGNKPVPYGFDKKIIPGMYFASLIIRKDSVAFYFFPCYMNPYFKEIAPTLLKCLKGKTCFHFKKEEQIHEQEFKLILAKGMEEWEKAGYMKD